MTFGEETIHFGEEIERLENEREELATEVVDLPDGSAAQQRKANRGQQIDAHLDGLEWAQTAHEDDDVPVWDDDGGGALTLAGLTGGDYGQLTGSISEDSSDDVPAQQVEIVSKVRIGTIEAPYYDDGATKTQTTAAIASLPASFVRWAAWKIEELSTVGNGDRNSFASLVAEKQTSE